MRDLKKTLETKLAKKIKTGRYMLSPKSFNYITLKTKKGEGLIKMPRLSARQDGLVDFLFHRLNERMERLGDRKIMSHKEFSIVLSGIDEFPNTIGWLFFDTTRVRKELCNKRYTDKLIIEDLELLRREKVEALDSRIWADEESKYKEKLTWTGSICGERIIKATTKIGSKTVFKIAVAIPLIMGLIWRNDILRKRYCLFLKDEKSLKCYYNQPHPVQKMFRYISLWRVTELKLWQFCDILNWSITTNPRVYKIRVEKYLIVLKDKEFITGWKRVKKTRSWDTRWKIWGIKTPE